MILYLEKEGGRILIKPSDGRKNFHQKPVHGLSFATTAVDLGCMKVT